MRHHTARPGAHTRGLAVLLLFFLHLHPAAAAPPPNDECAGAQTVSFGQIPLIPFADATSNPGDPQFPCRVPAPGPGFATLWYRFPAADASVTAATTVTGTQDTLLALFRGPCSALVMLDCNDDAAGVARSRVSATGLTLGEELTLLVALKTPAVPPGVVPLEVFMPGPSLSLTDECDGAFPLPCNGTAFGDTSFATDNPSDPALSCLGPAGGPAVRAYGTYWFVFTAASGSAAIDSCILDGGDGVLAVYAGPCGALTEIACNDDAPPGTCPPLSLLHLRGLTVGAAYHVLFANRPNTARRAYGLTLRCPDACPADTDASGETDANDLSAYLNAWYADLITGTTTADFNADGETDGNDLSDYINAWFAAIARGGAC